MDDPPIEEEEEPTSEFVLDGLELIFGRGRSGYKDVYPHRKGWQAKVTVEDKGVCSLGIFKNKKLAAIAVARARSKGLCLLLSPDKTRAKPGCGSACQSRAPHAFPHISCYLLLVLLHSRQTAVKRKFSSTPANIPTYAMATIENSSMQLAPVLVRPLGPVASMQACMTDMPAALAQPLVAARGTPTQQQQLTLFPDAGCLRGR
jgi:hypothetical protein